MHEVTLLPEVSVVIGLSLVLAGVLFLPFFIKIIEHNLEAFLFVMGTVAVTISGLWSFDVIKTAIISPVHPKHPIVEAVFIAGLIFMFLSDKMGILINTAVRKLGLKLFVILTVFILGLFSSVITAIIASLILVEIITILDFERKTEVKIVVFACYSIGIGAALTPVGEPLSTILVSRLKGQPYNADFLFLIKTIAIYVIPAVFISSLIAGFLVKGDKRSRDTLKAKKKETYKGVFIRSIKVYLFIMALELLAEGFSPVVDYIVPRVKPEILYWINIISAILDNATLTAAEITPKMDIKQIQAMLMGLLISGGMLIPGNIPNIISAGKLRISSKEWARVAVPFGAIMLLIYFVVLFVLKI